MDKRVFQIDEILQGKRLDKALATLCQDLSRSRLQTLIQDGHVLVNYDLSDTMSLKLKAGDRIDITIPDAIDPVPQAENILLDIVYEDDDILVLNKQAGLVVHPGAGNTDGTLVNALLHHCGDSLSGIGGVKRPGIVHRLDKDTSGLMIVAKHDIAHNHLSAQLADRSLSRTYDALVWRVPNLIKGSVDHPIGRHKTNRLKMTVGGTAQRDARTHYLVKETFNDGLAYIECRLETGRTHQIRVHMTHIRHPLVGDPLYGLNAQEAQSILNKSRFEQGQKDYVIAFPRQALHACHIRFIHPINSTEMSFQAPWPDDLQNLYNVLKNK